LGNLKILESKGESAIEGPNIESIEYENPLKIHKVNIGMKDDPKFANIGDYWNEENFEKMVDLLREYQDLFLTTFS
jgi:hypothetical protein